MKKATFNHRVSEISTRNSRALGVLGDDEDVATVEAGLWLRLSFYFRDVLAHCL